MELGVSEELPGLPPGGTNNNTLIQKENNNTGNIQNDLFKIYNANLKYKTATIKIRLNVYYARSGNFQPPIHLFLQGGLFD